MVNRINSRETLKDYALRKLGFPVIKINVEDSQIEDRIDDALSLFTEYHYDGSQEVMLFHQLTKDEINKNEIMLPDNVISISKLYSPKSNNGINSPGIASINLQYQMQITDILNMRKINNAGLGAYYITQSYLELINDTFAQLEQFTFNRFIHILSIFGDWTGVEEGAFIGIRCNIELDFDDFGEVYGNRWLQNYVVELIRQQWGNNLTKFGNVQLPGGTIMNGDQILQLANENVKILEDEVKDIYNAPLQPFMA